MNPFSQSLAPVHSQKVCSSKTLHSNKTNLFYYQWLPNGAQGLELLNDAPIQLKVGARILPTRPFVKTEERNVDQFSPLQTHFPYIFPVVLYGKYLKHGTRSQLTLNNSLITDLIPFNYFPQVLLFLSLNGLSGPQRQQANTDQSVKDAHEILLYNSVYLSLIFKQGCSQRPQ